MERLQQGFQQFLYTLLTFPRAWRFIRHHKLWEGLREYKWVFRFLLLIAGLAGLYIISEYLDWSDRHADDGVMSMFVGGDSLVWNLSKDTYESLTGGALKWIVLILLEVVIYHFMRSTLKIVLGRDMPDAHTFKPFLEAQKRMIAVSFFAYGVELAIQHGLFNVLTGMFGILEPFEPLAVVLLQSGLLGFAIVDNYNEQFSLKIKQSYRYTTQGYLGVCLGLGLPLFLMLKIPFIGTVFGPIVASVTAGIVMKEKGDLHTVGYIPSEKELKKMGKQEARRRRKEMRS